MVAPSRTARARLGRVREATRALAGATSHDQVVCAIFDEVLAALGAMSDLAEDSTMRADAVGAGGLCAGHPDVVGSA